jgi:predicted CopG family antitoxin
MTNITLSIDDKIYTKMRKYSEIKWSEFVRKIIQKRIEQLEKIEITDWENSEYLADEELLSESWLSKKDEKAFAYLQ